MSDEETIATPEPETSAVAELDYKDLWLRAQAEAENVRKRADADRAALLKYGQSALIEELLPVVDNFDRATKSVPADQQDAPWIVGINYIQKNLLSVLEGQGVSVITAKPGDTYDHANQEALGTVETDDIADDHIATVIANGYRLHDRLLRPVQVTVAKAKH
jgi:molecular chaperone GrpE